MGSRQVNEFGGLVTYFERANMTLNRDTRVVADALPETGQPVEQRALAGVGSTYHCDTGISTPTYRYLTGRYAYFG